jgi:hypothetical protein
MSLCLKLELGLNTAKGSAKIKKVCPALREADTSKQNEKPTFILSPELAYFIQNQTR